MNKIKNNTTCNQMAQKKNKFIYYDEECGNQAKAEIEYTLNDKLIRKNLCLRHVKSITSRLDIMKVTYSLIYKSNQHESTH